MAPSPDRFTSNFASIEAEWVEKLDQRASLHNKAVVDAGIIKYVYQWANWGVNEAKLTSEYSMYRHHTTINQIADQHNILFFDTYGGVVVGRMGL